MSDKKNEVFGQRETHESYGIMKFSRVSCGRPQPLFGSNLKHNDVVQMELSHAYMERSLNEDWFFEGKPIIRVEMSQSQFAELITSLNMGSGVPVTITNMRSDNEWLRMEEPPYVDRNELHKQEFKDHLEDTYKDLVTLIDELEMLFNTKKNLKVSDKQDLITSLKRIAMGINQNVDFQLDQFDRFMDKSVKEAKGEIEAFFQNKIHSIAKDVISDNTQVLLENPINLDEE